MKMFSKKATSESITLLVEKIHAGQTLCNGEPYLNHLLGAANIGENLYMEEKKSSLPKTAEAVTKLLEEIDELRQGILLHDSFEDQPKRVSEGMLRRHGVSEKVIKALRLITKKKGQNYLDYILAIKKDELACYMKRSDLCHNLKPQRLPQLLLHKKETLTDVLNRSRKYTLSYLFLSDAIHEEEFRKEFACLNV